MPMTSECSQQVPRHVAGSGATAGDKTDQSGCPQGLYILVEMTDDKRDKCVSRMSVTCAKEGREGMGSVGVCSFKWGPGEDHNGRVTSE